MLKALLCKLTAITLVFAQITVFAPVSVYAENTITLPETLRYPPREDGIERFTAEFIKSVFDKTHERRAQVRIPFRLVPVTQSAESMITTAEGGSVSLGNAQIEIPSGALERDTVIRITRLYETEDTGEDIRNATLGGGGYRFEPAGTVFNVPVTIKMGYDRQLTESAKETLYTYFYNTQERKWEQLERTALEEDYVVSVTTHFTDMINGTLTLPEGPAPLDFNINSIKGLEAANPGAGVMGLEGLEANNNGTASFRIPIEIPAGRAGMTPQVAVTYSSDGGNGIMGKGFNLAAGGSVTTDTRWGSPRFNGTYAGNEIVDEVLRDTYLLDGVKLKLETSSLGTGTLIYRPLRESRFDWIERHVTDGDYWVVTDKTGTQRTYGETYWSGSDDERKFTWELEEEKDVFGNTIRYVYSEEGGGRQLFLKEIIYTGHTTQTFTGDYGSLEGYTVEFVYDKENNGEAIREDIRVDGRGGFISRTDRLLTGIAVYHIDDGTPKIIRQYEMEYKQNFFGVNQLVVFGQLGNSASVNNRDTIDSSASADPDETNKYFWFYKFGYIDMKEGDDLFAASVAWEGLTSGLQSQTSESAGGQGSISGGVGIGQDYVDVRANVSHTFSSSEGITETTQTFIDINGDGRPDSVTYGSDGRIHVQINTGSGFEFSRPAGGDMPGNIGYDRSNTRTDGVSFGGGVGLTKIGLNSNGSITNQTGENSSALTFTDINGDGLIDIVISGESYYLQNTSKGSAISFEKTDLPIPSGFEMPQDIAVTLSKDEMDELDGQYYHQTPFREWRAPEAGSIQVKQKVKPVSVLSSYGLSYEKISSDGLKAKTYYPGNDKNPSEIIFNGGEDSSVIRESGGNIGIAAEDSIYFISDTGEDTRGDTIDWDITIYYERMRYFGDMDRKIRIITPEELNNKEITEADFNRDYSTIGELFTPNERGRIDVFGNYIIYEYYYTRNGSTWEYAYRNSNEQERRSSWDTIRRLGWFVPGVIDAENFELIWDEAEIIDDAEGNYNRRQSLMDYYQYHAGSDTYRRNEELINNATVKGLEDCERAISALIQSVQARRGGSPSFYDELAGYSIGQERFYPVPEQDTNNMFITSAGSERIETRRSMTPGYVYNEGGDESKKRLVIDIIDGEVWSIDIDVSFTENEASNTITTNLFSGGSGSSCYYYIGEKQIGSASYTRGNDGRTNITIPVINDGSGRSYSLFYEFSNLNLIVNELSAQEIEVIKGYIREEKYTTGSWQTPEYEEIEPILRFLSEDRENHNRRFFINAYERTLKSPVDRRPLPSDFNYELKKDLTGEQTARLNGILASYGESVFFEKDFPFYRESGGGRYVLKDEYKNVNINYVLSREGEIYNLMRYMLAKTVKAGYIYYAGDYRREIRYYAGDMHSIIYNNAPATATGSGRIDILMLERDNGGYRFATKSINERRTYWNSGKDFTTDFIKPLFYEVTVEQNSDEIEALLEGLLDGLRESGEELKEEAGIGTMEPDEMEISFHTAEPLPGRNGWYYGIWIGNQTKNPFNPAKMAAKTQTKKSDIENSYATNTGESNAQSIVPIDYMGAMNFERVAESLKVPGVNAPINSLTNTETGRNAAERTLTSVVSQLKNKDKGSNVNPLIYFSYINENIIHTSRLGGSSYYDIVDFFTPKEHKTGRMPTVRKGSNKGRDTAIPIISLSLLGKMNVSYNHSINNSSSRTYQSVQGIGGNGLTDIVQVSGSGLTVTEGSRAGFIEKYEIFDIKDINVNKTRIETNGGSFGASGASYVGYARNGAPVSISLNTGAGLSFADGTNSQTAGFIDLNGDGLPDYFYAEEYKENEVNAAGEAEEKVRERGRVKFNLGRDSFITSNIDENRIFDVSGVTVLNRGTSRTTSASISLGGGSGQDKIESFSIIPNIGVDGSFNFSSSRTNTDYMLMDINGDGLPDIVESDGVNIIVRFNMGDHFSQEGKYFANHGWNMNNQPLPSFNNTDGVPDPNVFNNLPMIGNFNRANEAVSLHEGNTYIESMEKHLKNLETNSSVTRSLSISGNAGLTIHIPVMFVGRFNITTGGGGGVNFSTSANDVSMRMMDMDGDGLPDRVVRVPGSGQLLVQRNLSGQVGLLNGVTTPQGGQYNIDYTFEPGTTDMPQSRYVMSEVKKINTTDVDVLVEQDIHSENVYTVKYEYTDGYYDREEKEFFGFRTVTTTIEGTDNTLLGETVTEYFNNAYYSRGMTEIVRTYGYRENDRRSRILLTETVNRIARAPFALIESETQRASENGRDIYRISKSDYKYDRFGNVTSLVQWAHGSETITAELTYDHNDALYIHANPASIKVTEGDSQLLRRREGSYNSKGRLTELAQRFNNEGISPQDSVSSLEWDEFGNLKKITDPNGAYVEYTYDEKTQQFVERIESGGVGIESYTSSIKWDRALGKKTRETDQNGNEIRYVYDVYGRLIEVWSPYDDGETPSVSYSYERRNNGTWYAVTDNKIHFSGNNPETLKTVIMTDSLGRVLYTAKQGEKWEDNSITEGIRGWNVSGFTAYDGKGRSIASGQPLFIPGTLNALLDYNFRNITLKNPTIQRYDELDRVVMTILPSADDTPPPIQRVSYNINNGLRETMTTDPLGNISVQTVDGRGNITQVQRFAKDENVTPLTSATYTYNGIGEMLSAVDADGNPLTITYDRLGRRTGMSSRDMGNREWQYDKAGNVIAERNSELSRQGRQINYLYDGMNRLTEIVYPFSENTRYEYGEANAANNSAGRVTKIIDETGTIEYNYGMLGEVKEETRIIKLLPLSRNETKTATMRYLSDYLGRMQEIVYPDGEVLTYEYNWGGEIKSVKGIRERTEFNYVNMVGYDEFTQRVYIEYGSGIETNYTYDPHRRWLSSIRTVDSSNNVIQNISYEFDTVGNVKGYENDTRTHTTSQSYTYDDLYQLITANGTSRSTPNGNSTDYTTTYRQSFMFDHIGNMQTKTSESFVSNRERIGDDLNYNLDYSYYAGTHKAERIGNRYYSYDQNGNLVAERDGGHAENTQAYRPYYHDGDIYWTDYGFGVVRPELSRPEDGVYQRNYKWNERNLLSESSDSAYTVQYRYGADGQRAVKYTLNTNRSTLYFNRMWQVNDSRESPVQSKHIYVGETRIATKNNSEGNHNTSAELNRVYYYHSDHLGSAQTVTNYQGQIHERLEYTPYGELWINWKSTASGDITPFRFTGKERDEETGLYYYGARYLDARTSRWLSGDPAIYEGDFIPSAPVNDEARKRNENLPGQGGIFNTVNMHAYHYAGNNPVKYTDPDGRNAVLDEDGNFLGTTLGETGEDEWIGVPIVMNRDDYEDGMRERDALARGGTPLNEYGKGIRITDETWSMIENNDGTRLRPFVVNDSDSIVYYKPEVDLGNYLTRGAYEIAPHTDLYAPVDGVRTSTMPEGKVHKVPDNYRVRINERGRPNIINLPFESFFALFKIAGRINAPDSSWHALRDSFLPRL